MFHSAFDRFSRIFIPFYEFIYPDLCHLCERPFATRGQKVCESCWGKIPRLPTRDTYYRTFRETVSLSGPIVDLFAGFKFEERGNLQEIIHSLKYSGITSLGVELGRRMSGEIDSWAKEYSVDGIIPVPLHSTKKRERGYNQSEFLAEGLSDQIRLPVFNGILKRKRYTESQTTLSAVQRRMNVAGAFDVIAEKRSVIKDNRYILIDDVITTCSTMEACAEVLVKAGALRPLGCAIALAM